MIQTILSISGKPGLYSLISQGKGMLIVESINSEKKRFPAGGRDRVTSLNDIAIYTDDEDMPLMKVFVNIQKKENGAKTSVDPKTAKKEELAAYMADVLPTYDRDRVYLTDIKKLLVWYNILVENKMTNFSEDENSKSTVTEVVE
ncbi:MAG: DUF5606 domain-containing protein [Bacteroidaceae bacterium]